MERRAFIASIAGGLVAVPLAARAQRPPVPVVGFLGAGSAAEWMHRVAAFRRGLAEAGYREDRSVTIEFRWAEGQYNRLPALAAELIQRNVSVLVAVGGAPVGMAAKAAASTTPVVFAVGGDPVELGLAASLSRPGGNMTGVSIRALELVEKLLSVLHELVPKAVAAGVLVNPDNRPIAEGYERAAQDATRTPGMKLHILYARTDSEIDAAFAALSKLHAGALLVSSDPFFESRRHQLIALAARQALPTLYFQR